VEEITRIVGTEHRDSLKAMGSLDCMYWKKGRKDDAKSWHPREVMSRMRVLGKQHPVTSSTRVHTR
jgi:hypothetical protein